MVLEAALLRLVVERDTLPQISLRGFVLLLLLHNQGPMYVSQLARIIKLHKSVVKRTIDQLEELRLVKKHPPSTAGGEDHRIRAVELRPEAVAFMTSFVECLYIPTGDAA